MSAKIPGEAYTVALHTGPGQSRLTLLMEATPGHGNYEGATPEAAAVSTTKDAVAIDECVFLGRHDFPKDANRQTQRHRRHALQASSVEPLATIRLADR
jgi:fatty-acyl-CoA synthase